MKKRGFVCPLTHFLACLFWYTFFHVLFNLLFCWKSSSSSASPCFNNSGIKAKGFVKELVCGRNCSLFYLCPSLCMLFARTCQRDVISKLSYCCCKGLFFPKFWAIFGKYTQVFFFFAKPRNREGSLIFSLQKRGFAC